MEMDEHELLSRRMLDAIGETVADTDWAPPDGGLVTEAVVVMGWMNPQGQYGTSHLRCGSPWGTEGLLHDALRSLDAGDSDETD